MEAITIEEIKALEALKKANLANTKSLQSDLAGLQDKQKLLEIDLKQHQNHLVQALLAKDKLEKELLAVQGGQPGSADTSSTAQEAFKQVSRDKTSLKYPLSSHKNGSDAWDTFHLITSRNICRPTTEFWSYR